MCATCVEAVPASWRVNPADPLDHVNSVDRRGTVSRTCVRSYKCAATEICRSARMCATRCSEFQLLRGAQVIDHRRQPLEVVHDERQ
jgi:hypothetical protein